MSAILKVSGKLDFLMTLNPFNFHFPIDFIGGQ